MKRSTYNRYASYGASKCISKVKKILRSLERNLCKMNENVDDVCSSNQESLVQKYLSKAVQLRRRKVDIAQLLLRNAEARGIREEALCLAILRGSKLKASYHNWNESCKVQLSRFIAMRRRIARGQRNCWAVVEKAKEAKASLWRI